MYKILCYTYITHDDREPETGQWSPCTSVHHLYRRVMIDITPQYNSTTVQQCASVQVYKCAYIQGPPHGGGADRDHLVHQIYVYIYTLA